MKPWLIRMRRFAQCVLWLAGALGWVWPAAAARDDVTLAPYFWVSGASGAVDVLPLKATDVTTVVAGNFAEVRVTQTYQNIGHTPLEAVYVFPGSTRAAVHGLTLTVGERRLEAQIKERAEARRTYEAAKQAGRTTALLEQERPNVFRMNVGHVLPGDTVLVELRYTELLEAVDGVYEWVFPTVVGPRYPGREQANPAADDPVKRAPAGAPPPPAGDVPYLPAGATGAAAWTLHATVLAGPPVRAVESPSHQVATEALAGGGVRVALAEAETGGMNRDFVLRYRIAGDDVAGGLLVEDWGGEQFFQLTLQPPARVEPAQIPARDYVFIVDVSGSMHGWPLRTTQRLLEELLVTLRAADTFNVVLFAGGRAVLAPEPLAATPENLAQAVRLIGDTPAGGGTELLPALRTALALPEQPGRARTLVLVSDGFVTVEAEAFAVVREAAGRANFFAFGIGGSVNRHLIEGLARAGRGEPTIVLEERDAGPAAAQFRARIEAPVLTQVRVTAEGVTLAELEPAALPDVFAERPVVLVGKLPPGPVAGRVRVEGRTGAGPWSATLELASATRLPGGGGVLARRWARERIRALDDLEAAVGGAPERKAALTALGLRYGLLTRWTSFVAVDVVARPAATGATTVKQPAVVPQGVTANAVGAQVPTTPEPETVGLVAVAGLAALVAWRRQRRKSPRGEQARG